MQIEMQIKGLDRLQAGAAAAPATLASETRTAMVAGSLLVEGTARTLAPKDTGRLAGSITYGITGGGANLTSKIGPSVAYGLYVEKGRAPGKMPPISAISPWATRHGLGNKGRANGRYATNSAAFAIARAIARRGTRPRPFLQPAFDSHRSQITRMFEKIGVRVVAKMAG